MPRRRPGRRATVRVPGRARGLAGTLGLTALSTVLPGSGLLVKGRRTLGLCMLVPALALVGFGGWYLFRDLEAALDFVFDPGRLTTAAAVVSVALLLWVASVVVSYVTLRRRGGPGWHGFVGAAFALLMCVAVAAPLALAARYSLVQADLVETVFEHNRSATLPKHVTEKDPWGGRTRVNLLLLGGDGGIDRQGVRTDSMILASMDVRTGRTVLFSLPRNLMNVPFPRGSRLAELYPDGFRGPGDQGSWLLNAVYREVPLTYPKALGASANEGADALKLAVQGALGQPVDYYLLVNLAGFRSIVEAMGGVSVNINKPIPVGGNSELGIPPDSYLRPGPNRLLNGFEALWFSRGRYGLDDYQRMERQRCMVDSLIAEAKPLTLLRRYQGLAAAGKQIVRSDVPRTLLPAFADLTLKVKDSDVLSLVFRRSDRFSPADPDFGWMRAQVRKALAAPPPAPVTSPPPTPSPTPAPTPSGSARASPGQGKDETAVDAKSTCGYRPER